MTEKRKVPAIRFAGFEDDWEQRKLGDFCEMFNGDRGINYPKDSDMVSDGIPFVNAGDLQEGKVNLTTANKITREKFDQLGGAKIKRGDILYCLRGTLGKNAFVDNFDEGTVASSLVDIRPKNIDSQYLFTVLNSDIEYRQRILCDEGAAQPNLSAKNLANFDIPVPEIEEQREIGGFFEGLSNLITFHQRKCQQLQMIKKSMLENMFPKAGEVAPKIRFTGFTDDWEQRKLDELVSFYSGLTYTPNDVRGSGTLVLRSSNVKDGEVVTDDNVYVDSRKVNSENVQPGDLIVVVRNGSRALIGKHAQIKHSMPNTVIGAFMTGIRADHPEFVNALLDTPQFKNEVDMNMGATINQITGYMFAHMEFMVPSDEEQDKIGNFFKDVDDLITLHQRKLHKLQTIKKSLLSQMFV